MKNIRTLFKLLLTTLSISLCTLGHGQTTTTQPNASTGALVTAIDTKSISDTPYFKANTSSSSQDAIRTFKGYQYVTFYNDQKKLCVARRKQPNGEWDSFALEGHEFTRLLKKGDGHNVPVLGLCPNDGTLHLSFDHHGNPLHYQVSAPHVITQPERIEWGPELFGPVTNSLGSHTPKRVTYPRFVATPQGDLLFIFREGGSGNGKSCLAEYTPKKGWVYHGTMIDRSGLFVDKARDYTDKNRCPYLNGTSFDANGRLHITWNWREQASSRISYNHDLMYAYSDDNGRTWFNNRGNPVAETDKNPIKIDTDGITVWDIPMGKAYVNQCTQLVDSDGRVHVLTWFSDVDGPDVKGYNDPSVTLRHFVRYADGRWKLNNTGIPALRRPKMVADASNNLIALAGNVHIIAATDASGWSDWSTIHEEELSTNAAAIDFGRWESEEILSVWIPNPDLKVIDYKITLSGRKP